MSSPLLSCPSIGTHRIQRNDINRVLIVDNIMIRFTPIEYRLLMRLLNAQAESDVELIKAAFGPEAAVSARENIDKHIDKMRSKLLPSGLSIHRVAKYGYVLLAAPE